MKVVSRKVNTVSQEGDYLLMMKKSLNQKYVSLFQSIESTWESILTSDESIN